MVLLKLRKLLN